MVCGVCGVCYPEVSKFLNGFLDIFKNLAHNLAHKLSKSKKYPPSPGSLCLKCCPPLISIKDHSSLCNKEIVFDRTNDTYSSISSYQ